MKKDQDRENRIAMDIIVDIYGEQEQMMGWYCYLDNHLKFPFMAKCILKRQISPLKLGEEVKVIEMADSEECDSEMFVVIKYCDRNLAIPLIQLKPIKALSKTIQAIEDWHYWFKK